ncbi:MAG: J domain-containing protein [Flavobacteriales bacterium]|nr:J domain-containing protein [Flavobacteriales bacterium]
MSYNPNPQDQGWVTCRDRLLSTIAKWQGLYGSQKPRGVTIECAAAPRYTASFSAAEDRAVSVTFTAGKHVDKTVTVDRFARPVDNLWALALGLDDIRMNELRGLDSVAQQVYEALPAPRQKKSPWEVLGLPVNSAPDVIEAVYRTKAKRLHPDIGGSAAAFKELTEAYEAVKRG